MNKLQLMLKIIGVVFITGSIVAIGIYVTRQNQEAESMPTIRGKVACLPRKDGQKEEDKACTKGLVNNKGLYLAVKTIPQDKLTVDETIDVEGELQPATNPDDTYLVSGTIVDKAK